MDNTYYLEVATGQYATVTQYLAFNSLADALAQLELLTPKMGERFHNDPDRKTHTVVSACGQTAFVCEHILSARAIDHAEFEKLSTFLRDRRRDERSDEAKHQAMVFAAAMRANKE